MKINIFLKKIIIFGAIFFALVVILNIINSYRVEKNIFKIDSSINKVFFGASTSECAINDEILKKTINMSFSADSYFYIYIKMNKILEINQNIDTVFLAITPNSISKKKEESWLFNKMHFSDRIGIYYYFMDIEELKMFWSRFGFDFFKISVSNIIVKSFRNFSKILFGDMRGEYGGYKPLKRDKLVEALNRLNNEEFNSSNYSISRIEVDYIDKMINICKKKNVELIFFSLPTRLELVKKEFQNYIQFDRFYKTKYSNFRYLDFSLFPLPDSAYSDLHHLKYSGSIIFSQYLYENGIKNIILEPKLNKYSSKLMIKK